MRCKKCRPTVSSWTRCSEMNLISGMEKCKIWDETWRCSKILILRSCRRIKNLKIRFRSSKEQCSLLRVRKSRWEDRFKASKTITKDSSKCMNSSRRVSMRARSVLLSNHHPSLKLSRRRKPPRSSRLAKLAVNSTNLLVKSLVVLHLHRSALLPRLLPLARMALVIRAAKAPCPKAATRAANNKCRRWSVAEFNERNYWWNFTINLKF